MNICTHYISISAFEQIAKLMKSAQASAYRRSYLPLKKQRLVCSKIGDYGEETWPPYMLPQNDLYRRTHFSTQGREGEPYLK